MAEENGDEMMTMLRALAKEQNVPVEELLAELLKLKADKKREAAGTSGTSSASGEAIERRRDDALDDGRHKFKRTELSAPGLSEERIRTYERESAAEARIRWEEEESYLPGGVLSGGGMTGGGIFGGGVIATSGYDPESAMRYEQRAGGAVQVKLLQVLNRMEQQLEDRDREIKQLRGGARNMLPGRRRGG